MNELDFLVTLYDRAQAYKHQALHAAQHLAEAAPHIGQAAWDAYQKASAEADLITQQLIYAATLINTHAVNDLPENADLPFSTADNDYNVTHAADQDVIPVG